jgi:nucleotide sugar dehydrogenase
MNVTVVGLGKIGLPLAVQYATKGTRVFGVDINQEIVDLVNQGREPFPGEDKLGERLSRVVQDGLLQASTDISLCVSRSEVVIVVVPLVIDHNSEPDFRSLDIATTAIAKGLQKGALVTYETTVPVGTTRNRFTRALENESGLKVGHDFFVSFSPERVLTGRIFFDLGQYPKIVGGITSACSSIARDFFSHHIDFQERTDLPRPNGVWIVESTETAEFIKIAETTYRDVNIALANQFAKFSERHKINVYEVIEAANSQRFSHIHHPGIAVGGHCIPVYPYFYLWSDPDASIVRMARSINEEMPKHVVSRVLARAGSLVGKYVLVLGISYRSGVKETHSSGVFGLVEELEEQGAIVKVWDPNYSDSDVFRLKLNPFDGDKSMVDVLFLQTDAEEFRTFVDEAFLKVQYIFDGRNMFHGLSPLPHAQMDAVGLQP